MLGYFRIRFIDFVLKGEDLFDHINVFFPNEMKFNIK